MPTANKPLIHIVKPRIESSADAILLDAQLVTFGGTQNDENAE
jgi:hypothetical protein